MKILFCSIFCCALAACAQPDPCASAQARVEADVTRVRVAADDLGVIRTIRDRSLEALKTCPQSARLWYLAARSAEVLEDSGLQTIVGDALAHAGNSPAVLTVAARVKTDVSLARKAMEVDPKYEPARRAVAELLAKAGNIDEALKLTTNPSTSSMHLTRARVLLAAKRPDEAIIEIKKIPPSADADELAPSAGMHRDMQEVLTSAQALVPNKKR